MTKKTFYITTPIYYVNDVPHIGHTCTTIAADILARYHKLLDEEVFFLTGTDEHGAKVAEAAKEADLSPHDFCDKVSQNFKEIWPRLNIKYDYFIRTTNPDHEKIVQEFIEKIYKKGDIYKGKYEGFYCVGCEKFVTETDLVNGKCPLHPNQTIQKQSEENYFFRLSKYIPTLIRAIENKNNPLYYEIKPESKREEVLSKLKAFEPGEGDLSISRANVSWGIPIPWDRTQTIYVWFDALLNYYTALKISGREKFWPANIHLIGKEILWFHAVIWEAMLISADIQLPREIFAHSFYMVDGQKMSKSLKNVISPQDLIKKFGADGTRYLIASSFPHADDSDVGWKKFTEKYNADLANGLGNLIARVAKIAENYNLSFVDSEVALWPNVCGKLDVLDLSGALSYIWGAIAGLDQYLNRERPWESESKAKQILSKIVVGGQAIKGLREIAFNLRSFLPETAEKIEQIFKSKKIAKPTESLFPRIDI